MPYHPGLSTDPLAGSAWTRQDTVAGFLASPPNADLTGFAEAERGRARRGVILDVGCGAGRNAVPLAQRGWRVVGTDLSWPMLTAARQRATDEQVGERVGLVLAPMHRLPVADNSCDLVVAHGIWNLATTDAEFRAAVREAARVARTGGALFVFTFSRNTFPADVVPVAGESMVFTNFSGGPQCFVTEEQLRAELHAVGFDADASMPLKELNRRPPGTLALAGPPVTYQGVFRKM